jgi:hypothetical protein
MKSPRRWTIKLKAGDTEPRGSADCLKRAIEKLGPFKQRLKVDAERFGPWGGLGVRIPLSEEYAIEQVKILAHYFNQQIALERDAPRPKELIEELRKLETLAGELARYMRSLNDMTRHRLHTAGTGIDRYTEVWATIASQKADVSGLPKPGPDDSDDDCRWIQMLEGLSEYAGQTLNGFLLSKGIEDVDRPDKGGNTNLFKEAFGSAQRNLVNQGWYVCETFKPGMSTGTDGGPFHRFLLDVFEYATGDDPENCSKLMPWIKRVVKVNRQAQSFAERESALIEEQCEIDAPESKLSLKERERQHADIESKLVALHKERYELWPQFYPFAKYNKNERQETSENLSR